MTPAQFRPRSLRMCLAEMRCSKDLSPQVQCQGFSFPMRPLLLLNVFPSVHSFPLCISGSCSLFTSFARGVNHLSPIGHQVDPRVVSNSGALPSSGLRFIGKLHNAFRETLGRNEPQGSVFILPVELLPLPCHERIDREIEHVEQVVLQQRLCEQTM